MNICCFIKSPLCFLLSQTSVSGMFTSGWNILIKEIGFSLHTTAAIYSHIKLYQNRSFWLMIIKPIVVMLAIKRKNSSDLSMDESVIGKFSVKRAGPAHWYSRPSQQIEPSEDIPERQTRVLRIFWNSQREIQLFQKISLTNWRYSMSNVQPPKYKV